MVRLKRQKSMYEVFAPLPRLTVVTRVFPFKRVSPVAGVMEDGVAAGLATVGVAG